MSIMLWPGVIYHNLLKKAYLKMEPGFMWLDYHLKQQMNKAMPVLTRRARSDDEVTASRVSMDDDDDFCPSMNPETIALLARAITDSEDESGTPSLPTPGASNQPSLENSDSEEMTNFNLPIDRMPSYDDLDQTDDDMDEPETKSSRMNYTPSHFIDGSDYSDSDDEDTLSKDLAFPEISEIQGGESPSHSNALSNLTSNLVSQTLTSMMQSALHRVTNMGDLSSPASSSRRIGAHSRITYTKTERGESLDLLDQELEDTIEEEDETVGAEAEIEKDFDFLEDFDRGDSSS
ncbi:reticulophagy regulator 3-like [Gigantopelta aegis]|uniref:reticulophagy regulator 3-like n=1 Tax=Gigantopelta aegis TaxID=1735272 RepID=UPI001B88AEDE|nr:reticulophagy regulator 3-like [Gigantopelta aegis]